MTSRERKKIAELERDIKKMQKDHKETFAEFEQKKEKKSLFRKITDRLREFFILISNK